MLAPVPSGNLMASQATLAKEPYMTDPTKTHATGALYDPELPCAAAMFHDIGVAPKRMKQKPETTAFAEVKADVPADKDPNLVRRNLCSVSRSSSWRR